MMWLEMDLPETILVSDLEAIGSSWLNHRRREISPKTSGRRLTALRSLGFAIDNPMLAKYTAPTPATPEPHPLPGGVDDLERMLYACNTDEHKLLITLCGLVGMRVAEARDTAPSSFIFADKKIRILGKGFRERVVPVSARAWQILLPIVVDCYSRPNDPMIKMCDRAARDAITRVGARAGVSRRVSSHDLRATFATEAYRKTKDLRAVQKLLGHANIKQTEVYVAVDDQSMRDAANILE